ncbi:MAG: SPOR domain-containing protein [Treponema sp.]|jgi:cell division protein FtsN|nr:SPOR domain-containing protein [Treponema sp.]
MEKKKIVFISVIIGLFLFIAIALPLSLLSSKDEALTAIPPAVSGVPKPEEPPADRPASMDVRDAIVNPPVAPLAAPPAASSGAQNVIINNYDTSGGGGAVPESKPASGEGETLTITVIPAAPAAQTPDALQRPAPSASSSAPNAPRRGQSGGASQTTQPKQTASSAQPAAKPAAKSTAKPAATTKPPASSSAYNYWIQTGAFGARPHAENAQKILKEKGVDSRIVSAVVKGSNVFRVRTGPYTTFNEASYWLKLIKVIDVAGLEESWIDPESK